MDDDKVAHLESEVSFLKDCLYASNFARFLLILERDDLRKKLDVVCDDPKNKGFAKLRQNSTENGTDLADLVTRLRDCWCGEGFTIRGKVDPSCDHDGVRAEAANEIERLQQMNKFLRRQIKQLTKYYIQEYGELKNKW